MKTEPRRFRKEVLQFACWVLTVTVASFVFPSARASGCFVAPQVVWDKNKGVNEPTEKAIIAYDAGHEDLILQVKYEGPVEEFGWLIPVPSLPTVQKASMDCFNELGRYTQEPWEPIMPHPIKDETEQEIEAVETKTVGAFEVTVLSAKDTDALKKWLDANRFSFPPGKSNAIYPYIDQNAYFVAVRIRLDQGDGFRLVSDGIKGSPPSDTSVSEKAIASQLNPLHLSFAAEKCVFPLKLSSVNGNASEMQLYLFSPKPLLEKTMFEKKLPWIYTNDLARAQRSVDYYRSRYTGAGSEKTLEGMFNSTRVAEPVPFASVTKNDLPNCSKEIVALRQKSWWLTKQSYSFQPEEMQDLEFEPAIPAFGEKLDSRYGYFAAACMTQFGSNTVPVLLAALQGSNSLARSAVTSIFDLSYPYTEAIRRDARFREMGRRWLNDSNLENRTFAVTYYNASPEELLTAMHDENFEIAATAGAYIRRVLSDPEGEKYLPDIQEMLKDKNPATRAAALFALSGTHVILPREELLPFLTNSNVHVVANAYAKLTAIGGRVSNEEALPLLQSSDQSVRLMGLQTLYKNAQKSSIDLLLPFLKDKNELIAFRAGVILRALTGQHFTEQQAEQWEKWWNDNKASFVVQLHPEELERSMPRMRQYLKSRQADASAPNAQ